MSFFAVTEQDFILQPNEVICYIETNTPLTPEHRQLYDELYQYVRDLISRKEPWTYKPTPDSDEVPVPDEYIEYLRNYAHKKCIARHLKGTDYDMKRSKLSFKTVVEWRIKENIDNISHEDYKNELDLALVYCTFCRGKLGHPVAYFKFPTSALDGAHWDIAYRSAIYAAEKGCRMSAEVNLFQTIWILDFKNLSYSTSPPYATIKEMIHLWTMYYPERLKKAYIVNAPWAFRALWAFASAFLTDNTKGKIQMLDSEASQHATSFGELIEPKDLHMDYGGTWNETYSWEYEDRGVQKSKREAEQRRQETTNQQSAFTRDDDAESVNNTQGEGQEKDKSKSTSVHDDSQ